MTFWELSFELALNLYSCL